MNPLKWGQKEQKPPTLQDELKDLGVHFQRDEFFRQSLQNIDENAQIFSDEDIDAMHLSDFRSKLMKRNSRMLKYLMHHVPHAKAIENPRFGEAMEAAIDLLHEDYRRILSKSTDEAVLSEVTEDWSQVNILVGYSFDKDRTSIMKSVAIQQAVPNQGGNVEVRTHNSADPTNQS